MHCCRAFEPSSEIANRTSTISFSGDLTRCDPGLLNGQTLSEERKLLLGGYFTHEYSLEAAALFNPSMVPHPDQSDVPPGALRFILSLRATAEGHISSITFRSGMLDAESNITMDPPSRYCIEPSRCPARPMRKPCSSGSFRNSGSWAVSAAKCSRPCGRIHDGRTARLPQPRGEAVPGARAGDGQEHRQGDPDARPIQLRSTVRAGFELVRAGALPCHALTEQRHRGRPIRPLPAGGRHADLLRDLHRVRRQE